MSKSHRKSSSSSHSPSSSSSASDSGSWLDQAASFGNAFLQSMMQGSSGPESSPASPSSNQAPAHVREPISEDWLEAKVTRIQNASIGGAYVEVEGPQLEFLDLDAARQGVFTGVTRPHSKAGQVYEKPGDKRAKLWFQDEGIDTMKHELKEDPTIDLFALDG